MAGGRRPILRGKRVFLRPAEREDVPTFLEWLADADVSKGLATRAPWSRVAEEAWFDRLQQSQGKTAWHFVICLRDTDRPIGFCRRQLRRLVVGCAHRPTLPSARVARAAPTTQKGNH